MRLTKSTLRPTRDGLRRTATAAAAAGLFVGALASPSPALAATTVLAPEAVSTMADQLGSPGSYLENGRMVVTLTDAADAAKVRGAGAVPKLVSRSAAQLADATRVLDSEARIAGTAWSVDPKTNQVLVTVDDSVGEAGMAQLTAVTDRLGSAVRVERTSGTFSPTLSGGQAIYGGGARCSLGFNVRSAAGTQFFLTAGHCTNIAVNWYTNSSQTTLIGPRSFSSFPGNDYGIVKYSNSAVTRPGNVWLYSGSTTQDITRAADPAVGQAVRRSGSTTGLRSGSVTGLNATVNYAEGTVTGLIRTNVCAEGGDSGGSLFYGTTAYGLTSGGSGNCRTGGTTFFQPVTEALRVYAVSVY